jgi:ABC-type transport system involved in cytochrome bd biosynthesis fused ATPase/permease subunit
VHDKTFPVSFQHHNGLLIVSIEGIAADNETAQAVMEACTLQLSAFKTPIHQVALVGETGIGHSTLINALLGKPGQKEVAVASK